VKALPYSERPFGKSFAKYIPSRVEGLRIGSSEPP
jgi:hypothetical protein